MLTSQPQKVHLHAVLNVEVNLNIDGEDYKVIALVDTGAEVNLIKKGLIPERHLRTPPSPITIITADSSNMAGGNLGVMGLATFQGVETDLKIPIDVQCPIHLYEANITSQAILSYEWMATHDFMVVPRRHALHYRDANSDIVIQGIGIQTKRLSRLRKEGVKTFVLPTSQAKGITDVLTAETPPTSETTEPTTMPTSQEDTTPAPKTKPVYSPPVERAEIQLVGNPPRRPRMLDLFCGTNSVGDVFRKRGYDVESVDLLPQYSPTICCDILDWDYETDYHPGHFEVIAASPPCTEYSSAMTMRPRRLELADSLVRKTLEIIQFFRPNFWFMENPRLGLLKTRRLVMDLPYLDVDYCQFSDWGYQKPTRIWGSPHLARLKPVLCDIKTCPNKVTRENGREAHRNIIGATPPEGAQRIPKEDQYRIPEGVIRYLTGWDRKPSDWNYYVNPNGELPTAIAAAVQVTEPPPPVIINACRGTA